MMIKNIIKTKIIIEAKIDNLKSQRGVTAIEYGVMAAGLALALSLLFSSDSSFIEGLKNAFKGIADKMNVGGK